MSLNNYMICSLHCTLKPVILHCSASCCSTTDAIHRLRVVLHLSALLGYCHDTAALKLIRVSRSTVVIVEGKEQTWASFYLILY